MKKIPPGQRHHVPDETGANPPPGPGYLEWFAHFNATEYYEAHDALEALWLRTEGSNRDFFKGLIQVAGAFVHLRKHSEHPGHAKHTTRLRPAARLFLRAKEHLTDFSPRHLQLDVTKVCALCESLADGIEKSDFSANPWSPAKPPQIGLIA